MSTSRVRKVQRLLAREISEILSRGIKDPRVSGITVVDVDAAPDLKSAVVYYRVLGDDPSARKEAADGLKSATSTLKRKLGSRVKLKFTPNILFKYDTTYETAQRIEELLEKEKQKRQNVDDGPVIQSIVDCLREAENAVVAAHHNPEGDAIGATLAVSFILEKLGVKVHAYNKDGVPDNNKFLNRSDLISRELPEWEPDTVVVVDCGDFDRVGEARERLEKAPNIINIDHHETNSNFGNMNWVRPGSASTSEMIIELVDAFGNEFWSPETANALYTGIQADTGSFQFNNTSPDCLRLAARMVEKGADPSNVAYHLYADIPQANLELLAMSLSTLEVLEDGKIASVVVTREMFDKTGAGPDATEGFVDFPRSIRGVEVAALFRENKQGEYKISMRASGDFDVAGIARSYGGGGHAAAAGCTINGTLEEVKSDLMDKLTLQLNDALSARSKG